MPEENLSGDNLEGAIEQFFDGLAQVETLSEFRRFYDENQSLFQGLILDRLNAMANDPITGESMIPFRDLVRDTPSNVQRAWRRFARAQQEVDEERSKLINSYDRLYELAVTPDLEELDRQLGPLIDRARRIGAPNLIGDFEGFRSMALLNLGPGTDRKLWEERTISSLDVAAKWSSAPDGRVHFMDNLARCFAERVGGDHDENLRISVRIWEDAVRLANEGSDADSSSTVEMNLALALVRKGPHATPGDLARAHDLCVSVLDYRTIDKDPDSWAEAKVNLGTTLESIGRRSRDDQSGALSAYDEIIENGERLSRPWQLGNAYYHRARLRRRLTEFDPEALLEAYVDGKDLMDEDERGVLLQGSLDDLARAIELSARDPDEVRRGRIWAEYALVLDMTGHEDEAVEASRQALGMLSATNAPTEFIDASIQLAKSLANRGEWAGAARGYEEAISLAHLRFHDVLETRSRETEGKRLGETARWAAFALAKAGRVEEAIVILENGRTRELRRRIGVGSVDDPALEGVPEELRARLKQSSEALRHVPVDEPDSQAGRELQQVILEIRNHDGLEDFGKDVSYEEILETAEPGWPLVYVNPTPWGLQLILVVTNAAPLSFEFEDPTALEAWMRLFVSDGSPDDDGDSDVASYAIGISRPRDERFDRAIEFVLRWFGEAAGRHIANRLRELGASGVSLIICGPMNLLPLAASAWHEGGVRKDLISEFSVRYVPSATALRASRRDRNFEGERLFLGLADPLRDLPAAEGELREIRKLFSGASDCAYGDAADSRFLLDRVQEAHTIHLACHAVGSIAEPELAGVLLSDTQVSASRLSANSLQAELVVVSACQTAIPSLTGIPGEVFATSTALLISGAACVVASLWSVHSAATALLMVKMYQGLTGEPALSVPVALTAAQLWMRDLTKREAQEFVDSHPDLAGAFRQSVARGERNVLAEQDPAENGLSKDKPFSHPYFWAPFVAVGA